MLGFGLGLNKWRRVGGGYVGLLDLFPNAAAAYSLRKLRAAYSGSAVRVRKEVSLVSSETDIGFAADGSLDTVSLLAFASDADNGDVFVVTWYDQSLSNNATQATAGSQEIIVSNGNVVQDSAGDPAVYNFSTTLKVGAITSVDQVNSQTYTIATVAEVESVSTSGCFLGDFSNASNFLLVSQSGSADSASKNYTPLSIYKNGASITITTRGQAYTQFHIDSPILIFTTYNTGTTFGDANDFARLWGYHVSTGFTARRKVKEWIIYDSDQSSNRTGIETNINTFYSIYP
jgi:hypothetical protein